MKCPKCGSFVPPSDRQCGTCKTEVYPDPPGVERAPNQAEWRKQVTQKVKAYGERKKILTTPPRPLKEGGVPPPEREVEPSTSGRPDPGHRLEPKAEGPQAPPVVEAPVAPVEIPRTKQAPMQEHHPIPAPDLDASDLIDVDLDEDLEAIPFPILAPPRYLGRRLMALLADHAILAIVMIVILYATELVTAYSIRELQTEFRLPLACAFLLFHLMYYVYFYKTSRQTPGQLFFRLELKDPLSGSIPLRRVLTRWLAFVVLNVFNLVPVLTGDKPLLLDRISGTEIRKLSHE